MSLPKEGMHKGKITGSPVIAEAKTGAVMFVVPCKLTESEVAWGGKHQMVLIGKDGTPNQNTIKTIKAVFGCAGTLEEIDALQDKDCTDIDVEFTDCKHETYTPDGEGVTGDVTVFKTGWMNPPGGASLMPEPTDRNALLAKYRVKFAALSGGKPATKPATKAVEKKVEPEKKASGPPKRSSTAVTAPTATMDEAVQAFTKSGLPEEAWFAASKEFSGQDDDNEKLTIQHLGLMKQKFEQAAQS